MNNLPPMLPALLALVLIPACGASDETTGFTGATEALSTGEAATGDPSTTTGSTGTGTGTAPTTGEASTAEPTTGAVGETSDSTSTGETGTTGDTTGDTTGTTGDTTGPGTTGTTGDDAGDTLYAIQDGTLAAGSPVAVAGVIVTAVAPDLSGLYVQEPDGGEYSGVWVEAGGQNIAGLAIGDEVDVVGTAVELDSRTAIDVAAGSVTPTGVENIPVAPAPVLSAIFTKAVLSEPWESVLIRLDGAPLAVAGIIGAGEFKLVAGNDALVVDDFLYNVPADMVAFPGLGVGASFTQVAGVLNADGDLYKLAPRRATDLLGYKKP